MATALATVAYPIEHGKILLGRKGKKIGKGLLNGYGGKTEDGDLSIVHTACRELYEETGLGIACHPLDMKPRARVQFYFHDSVDPEFNVVFFITKKFTGVARSTEEMLDPQWYELENLYLFYDQMLPADKNILERILSGKTFKMSVRFTEDMKSFEEFDYEETEEAQIL